MQLFCNNSKLREYGELLGLFFMLSHLTGSGNDETGMEFPHFIPIAEEILKQ